MNATELYLQNRKLIHMKAKKFSFRTGIETEELECQANLIFLTCIPKYDNKRAAFSTYLSHALDSQLSRYLSFFSSDTEDMKDVFTTSDKTEKEANFSFWIQSLSKNSQEIVDMVLNRPDLPVENQKTKKVSRKSIKNYLRKTLSWKTTDIGHSFNEIEMALERL